MRIATAIRSLVLTAAVSIIPAASYAGVFVSIGIGAPPVLPVYAQPICPAAGYIWTPGYWAYDDEAGYYWVPGAWVLAPYTGALWTPGYWGWGNGGYYWHPGYWGRHVGFYGGVNYGFGYFGRGYEGGYWDHDRFAYNRSVTNVNIVNVHNVYNKTVINNYNTTRVSFNGGHGGVQMRPTQQEQNWGREQHTAPLPAQHQNEMRASQNRLQFANVNHGRPQNLARTEPASYNRNMLTTNRPSNTMAPTTHPVNTVAPGNIHSPAVNNARPMPTDQNVNRAPVNNNNVAHPQTNPQLNQHAQPQPNRPQPSMQANQHMQPQPMRPEPQQMRQPQQQMRTEPQQVRSQQPQMHSEPQQMRQAPQQMHSQPQQMRSAPQQPHPQEFHGGGGGHDGGHGRGR
jgi:WXXGXW repeat (2 copies)